MDASRWVTTPGELARLKLLNLLGETHMLDRNDERAYRVTGLDEACLAAAWQYLHLRGLVLFEPERPAGTGGMAGLSGDAILDYRARLRRLADPVAMRWTLRGALLDWLVADGNEGFSCLTEFQRDPRAMLEGIHLAHLDEVLAAAVYLRGGGLVEVIDTAGTQLVKVKLTTDGQDLAARIRPRDHTSSSSNVTGGRDNNSHSQRTQTMKNSPSTWHAEAGSAISRGGRRDGSVPRRVAQADHRR